MIRRVDAASRTGLAVLGLIFLAAGGLGLATALNAFPTPRAHDPVLPETARRFAADHAWFWWAVAGLCLLVVLLALWWFQSQLRTERTARIDRTIDARDGYTVVHVGALADAVEHDAEQLDGVTAASAQVSSQPTRLWLRVDLADYADLHAVRRHLEEVTVAHVRQALDEGDFPVTVELRPTRTTGRSVA